MMKSILLAFVLIVAPAGMALADNDVGCGVGTEVWKGQSGLGPKLGASFTNGLTFQSVSVTFGLINCNGRDAVTADATDLKLRHYASSHLDRLAQEMAEGRGESLDAFAALMQVKPEDREAFGAFTQSHFEELFSHDRVSVGEMLGSLDRLLSADETLSAYARS